MSTSTDSITTLFSHSKAGRQLLRAKAIIRFEQCIGTFNSRYDSLPSLKLEFEKLTEGGIVTDIVVKGHSALDIKPVAEFLGLSAYASGYREVTVY